MLHSYQVVGYICLLLLLFFFALREFSGQPAAPFDFRHLLLPSQVVPAIALVHLPPTQVSPPVFPACLCHDMHDLSSCIE
jgi:hypothetical protein